jgi:NAD-reducing hydrogenase small subunit
MSLLDLDEGLLALAPAIELVASPLAGAWEPAEGAAVDVTLVEGAVATTAHLALLRRARARSRALIAVGDCAASGNVTGLRDRAGGAAAILRAAWAGGAARDPALPALLDPVLPLDAVVRADLGRALAGAAGAPRLG